MRDYSLNLDAGSIERSLNVAGNWFHVLEATNTIAIRFDEGPRNYRQKGQGGTRLFNRVSVSSVVAQNVVLALGFGQETDSRASVGDVNVSASNRISNTITPLPEVSIPPLTSVILCAADVSDKRIYVRLGVKSDQIGGVYIGDATVNNNLGSYLENGSVEFLECQAAIHAYNPNNDSVIVNVMTLSKV